MNRDLLRQIESAVPEMSKGHKTIARYILAHYDKAAFLTASKLGANVGVSESTVVRFAYELGFEGYPQLQSALQDMIRNKLTSVQRIEVSQDRLGNSDILSKVLTADIEKIRRTLESISREDFEGAVDSIINARRIYIIGVRSSFSLASFLGFYFNNMFDNVRNVTTTSVSEVFEQILRIGSGDVLIAVTFPRYSRRTVNAAKYAHNNGATVISVTDSPLSPIAEYSHRLLLAQSDMTSFVDSLVAPLSLLNALIVAIGLKKQDELSSTFHRLEQIWAEYNVYQSTEEGAADDRL